MSEPRGWMLLGVLLAGCQGTSIGLPATSPTGNLLLRLEMTGARSISSVGAYAQVRLRVDGLGQSAVREVTVAMVAGGASVTLNGVPAGPNRVVVLDGLDADGREVASAHWETVVTVPAGGNATAVLSTATTPAGQVIDDLLAADRLEGRDVAHGASTRLDAAALLAAFAAERTRLGVAHPCLFDAAAIAASLAPSLPANSTAPLAPAGVDWSGMVRSAGRVRLILSGLPASSVATASLDDPLSVVQQNLTAGGTLISPVAPGTWTLTVAGKGGLLATASVTVSASMTAPPTEARLDLGRWQALSPVGALPIGAAWAPMTIGGTARLVMAGGSDGLKDGGGAIPCATTAVRSFDGTNLALLAPMPTALAWPAAAISGGKLWVFGGMKSNHVASSAVYSFNGQSWSGQVATLNVDGTVGGLVGAVAAEWNAKIMVVGGSWRRFARNFDPATGAFSAATGPLVSRQYPASVVWGGKWYLFGGNGDYGFLSSAERYDPVANTWHWVADLPVARFGAQAIVLADKIYLVGGMETDGRPSARVDVYDPTLDTWSAFPALNQARGAVALGLLQNRLYVMGGGDGLFYQSIGVAAAQVPVCENALEVLRP